VKIRAGDGVEENDVGVYWWHWIGFFTRTCVMVRVVTLNGVELSFAISFSSDLAVFELVARFVAPFACDVSPEALASVSNSAT
jgi:hypothetical protein